jgi:undecaprenyl pyrophosphate phosphatase UppP
MKFPTLEMNELRKIEATIGFTSGILIGAISAMVLILFFTPWEWYFKVFSFIGSAGIIGSLYMALSDQIKIRRNYLQTIKEMENINLEANKVIETRCLK